MNKFKDLHLASNLDALDLIATKDCPRKAHKVKFLCNILTKLYQQSQQNVLDQELTYILLKRYLNIYKVLYDDDPRFTQERFKNEHEKVVTQYNEIRDSLQKRYAALIPKNVQVQEGNVHEVKTEGAPVHTSIFLDDFINCQQLYNALKNENVCMLLVDARRESDFEQSKLNKSNCINVPDSCITLGLSANALSKKLSPETQKVWEVRDTFHVIVLFDWDSTAENFATTKLANLRSALVDWDINRNYPERPVVLNGGYLEWLHNYPTLCTNPQVYLHQKDNELDELLELEHIEYPSETDAKAHVMGIKKEQEPVPLPGGGEMKLSTSKENLFQQHKQISDDRHQLISHLLRDQAEWKRINELLDKEESLNKLNELKTKEDQVNAEIAKHEQALRDASFKKEEMMEKINQSFEVDVEMNEAEKEEVTEIVKMEEADSDKLRILDEISDERLKILKKARAAKPALGTVEIATKVDSEARTPLVNRANKPSFYQRLEISLTSGLIGLKNIRNTCYMNTVIQCVRNIPLMKSFFFSRHISKYNIRTPAAIFTETAQLFRTLWTKPAASIEPIEFYEKVCTLEPTYRLGHHEDCMEFFLFLLNNLGEDCTYDMKKPSVMTPSQKAWFNQFLGKNSPFIDLFYHQIRINQRCMSCDQKTIKFEIESTFMLSVPLGDFHLDSLMAEYMSDYVIDDYRCAKCKKPVSNKKEIVYKPRIVVIVLKRYIQEVWNGNITFKKNESRCHFKKYNFQIGKDLYHLNAIALHSGNMDFGHYTAVCSTPKGWFEFSDEVVKPVDIGDDSIKRRACAFFYSIID